MGQPHTNIGCVANLFARQMHFVKAGDKELGHTHVFDHLTLLASGALRVTVNGAITEFRAPHMIYIKADHQHELVAIEDNTVAFCIHALRNGDGVGDIIDPQSIPKGVNPLAISKSLTAGSMDMGVTI
jgi:hypothetical protein